MNKLFLLSLLVPLYSIAAKNPIPLAQMALEDGRTAFAQTLLQPLIDQGKSSQALEETLLKADLQAHHFQTVLTRLTTLQLPPSHARVFRMAAYNGLQQYHQTVAYCLAEMSAPADAWDIVALRLLLEAQLALATPNNVTDTSLDESFIKIDSSPLLSPIDRAENARTYAQQRTTEVALQALRREATQFLKGDVYLNCLFLLSEKETNAEQRLSFRTQIITALKDTTLSLAPETRAILALAAVRFNAEDADTLALLREAVTCATSVPMRQLSRILLGQKLLLDDATFDEGIEVLEAAIRIDSLASNAANIQLFIAEQLADKNLIDRALVAYQQYFESFELPQFDLRVKLSYAALLRKAQRPEEAMRILERAAKTAEDTTAVLFQAAEAAEEAKLYKKATELLASVLEGTPSPTVNSYIVQYHLAYDYEAIKAYDQALPLYQKLATEVASENPQLAATALLRLGNLYLQHHQPLLAVEAYTQVLPDFKSFRDLTQQIRLARGYAYYQMGEFVQAEEDFNAVADAKDETLASDAFFYLLLTYYGEGEDEKALACSNTYEQRYPHSTRLPDILLWQAKQAFNTGAYSSALQKFIDFTQRWPQDNRVPQARYFAARAAYQIHEYTQTNELVAKIAVDSPTATVLPDARYLQCEALMELARYSEATEILDVLIRQNPDATWIAEAYGRKAECLFLTATDNPSRYELAKQAYTEAIARNTRPDNALMYHYKVARVLEKQNKREAALECYLESAYTAIGQAPFYSDVGLQWLQKTLIRIQSLELASGNEHSYNRLIQRIRNSKLPATILPQ